MGLATSGARVFPDNWARLAKNLHNQVVLRACRLAGGEDALAGRLGVSAGIVRTWRSSPLAPPARIFFKLLDILGEEPVARAPESGTHRTHERKKPA